MAKYRVKIGAWLPTPDQKRRWWAYAEEVPGGSGLDIRIWSGPTKKAAIAELRRLLAQMPDVEIVEEP